MAKMTSQKIFEIKLVLFIREFLKISPYTFLSKRGKLAPLLKKGMEGDFSASLYQIV